MKLQPVAPTDSASYGAEDVPYTRNFFAFLAPAWLDHTALLAGVRPPAREPRLTWCDFGCGHGVTAALLAATHPAGMFYGVDLMPDHVNFARRLVDDADIPNAIFHTADFATIDLDLPRFDYIVAHGIYSWVGAAVRDALSNLIGRHLKSDGLVYVSYDAMPGCTLEVPCQRLLRELSATFAGNSVARLEAAARIVRGVAGAAAQAWANNRLVSSLDPRRYDYSAPEVVHSYMTTTWQPFFVTEMRAMMAAIGLVPAGSATLINNYDSYILRRSEREVLATIADVDLRELARDFFLGTRFRTDVFARPDRAMGEDEQRRRLFDSVLALVLPAEEISYAVTTPAGRVAYDNDTARAIVAALASAPARLADIVANSALVPQDLLANALMLCAAGDARPMEPVQASVADLNRMILRRLGTPEEIRHLALPFGTALEISDEDDPRAIGLLRHYLPDLAFAHPSSNRGRSTKGEPPDWVVAISTDETASGEFSRDTETTARRAFDELGCVLLRGAFPVATIEAMHDEYVAQFGSLDSAAMGEQAAKPPPSRFLKVGDARYQITLCMTRGFAGTEVFANSLLLPLLHKLLGSDMHLNSFTASVSHPGAQQQHIHTDAPHLFSELYPGRNLPVHAVSVAVPLIDVDLETGPTAVWLVPSSPPLRLMSACPMQRGDCMLLDYRTVHSGLPNRSGRARPIVYMVYARPWFFDQGNYVESGRAPLDMPLECYDKLPASVRPLLVRAFSYAMLAR